MNEDWFDGDEESENPERTKRPDCEELSGTDDFEVKVPVTQVGRYEIKSQLGRGGFGFVYLASDPVLKRNVAIKVPRWDKSLDARAVDRFLHEGRMLAQLSHPAIVSVYDVGVAEDGVPYVVMQFVEGRSLAQVLQEGMMPADVAINYLLQIARALQTTHQHGLVHRDFKPSNVIVDQNGEIHLVDFGLALHEDLSPSETGKSYVAGTPAFMAPEQLRGENHLIDGQTDIWAFGVTMYLMLSGKAPFKGSGFRELSRIVCYRNPRPLRQHDAKIPRELERICFRCLEKLIEDRYRSMADVIEELESFVAAPEPVATVSNANSQGPATGLSAGSHSGPSGSQDRPSGSQSNAANANSSTNPDLRVRIVPKGLRAFDQNDHDFFLSLLPGPRDRHGIPESVRFWQARLDPQRQIEDVAVGLIYGPSGCGKSSFVRAGLMPQLSQGVVPVYVDCSHRNLEQHIASRIGHEIHLVDSDKPLVELVRELRVGKHLRGGDRVLLILDQFEQWLNQNQRYEDSELTQALRQCSSQRVQALLLVRDEFWLRASQFLKCLETRIEESRNAMSLPLLDERHARKVLEAYGRAHGSLPSEENPLSKAQSRFLEAAVSELAQNGRVICVHLAVFAETVKGRPWEISQYRQLGGWQGIGREYIAGIFANRETPEFIKKNSTAAWNILCKLLPESSETIKGKALTRSELHASSRLEDQNRFDEVLHFLERDSGLITAVDRGIDEDGHASANVETQYGLTHDFLVEPIRAWGSAKQSETATGRATAELQRLSEQWKMTRDRRFFPSLADYCRMKILLGRPERLAGIEYWKKATSRFLVKMAIAGCIAFASLAGWQFVGQREYAVATERYLDAPPGEFEERWKEILASGSSWMETIFPMSELVLREGCVSSDLRRRIRSVAMLAAKHPDQSDYWLEQLFGMIAACPVEDLPVYWAAVDAAGPASSGFFETIASKRGVKPLHRARLGLLFAIIGDLSLLERALAVAPDPETRTATILDMKNWEPVFDRILNRINREENLGAVNGDLLCGLCWGIGVPGQLDGTIGPRIAFLQRVFIESPHGGAHYTAMYGLEQMKWPLPVVSNPPVDADWRTITVTIKESGNKHDLYFVRIRAGSFGPPASESIARCPKGFEKLLTGIVEHDYWIQVNEVPSGLFAEFAQSIADDHAYLKRIYVHNPTMVKTTLDQMRDPAEFTTPYVGCLPFELCQEFCNWLGSQAGFDRVYIPVDPDDSGYGFSVADGLAGFGLPGFNEFEYALRAGTESDYFFGNNPELLSVFVGYQTEPAYKPVRSLPPNAFGCFEMVSNLEEWIDGLPRSERRERYTELTRGAGLKSPVDHFKSDVLNANDSSGSFTRAGFRLVARGIIF
jgi:serine/threonine protein kinase/formylglycine-generating enzyme required for sulfatase activity/energy-coupling factor transporter ATP-binding protein EcfA2